MIDEPPDWHEPHMPPMPRVPEVRLEDLNRAVDAAINAIGDRRGREAARKLLDELRRATEQDRRRRNR
jgi:hypothetical protein